MDEDARRVARQFGETVRGCRERVLDERGRKMSQERLGEVAGLHRTYIGHVERGEVNVALYNIVRIAGAIGVDPAVLVTGLVARSSARTITDPR